MAYYQDGRLVLQPGDEGYAGKAAPAGQEISFDDGDTWHRPDERIEHEFGWRIGVLRAAGIADDFRALEGLAARHGVALEGEAARSLLGTSRAFFRVSGTAFRVRDFMLDVEELLGRRG